MIKIENVETYGWEAAIRGMRNPMNSWDKSDSHMCLIDYGMDCQMCENDHEPALECDDGKRGFCVGKNDLTLMKKLSKAGNDHGKFLRMITVTLDITAPLYWWKEFDTYKVGTVCNSCSTMHKIHSKEFTLDDFSLEQCDMLVKDLFIQHIVPILNIERDAFRERGLKVDWYSMIQLLPTSYNQRRTVQLNYAVLKNMYHARKNHKLDEWHTFCEWCESLPYFKELV